MPDKIQLFYEFSEGQIYESAGLDDLALEKYMQCKTLSETLSLIDPDRALSFCGLGSVFYHVDEFKFATRCFQKVEIFTINC